MEKFESLDYEKKLNLEISDNFCEILNDIRKNAYKKLWRILNYIVISIT